MDFTPSTYKSLLMALQSAGYQFITFEDYCRMTEQERTQRRFVILRHDVDAKPKNSLRFAQIENSLSIRASYYFRIVPESNQPDIIRHIAALQHEIGYHYEDLSLKNGDMGKAIQAFRKHLDYFRRFYSVATICMHGAPTSPYDSKDLWETNNYRDFGIIGEPYFDMDFDEALYLTDTGRCWDGFRFSVRDKVPQQEEWSRMGLTFHSTKHIIRWLERGWKRGEPLCNLMITTHPQRWTPWPLAWIKELVLQTTKNIIKSYIINHRK